MELTDFDAYASGQESGVRVEILDPRTGEPTGAVITICGPDTLKAHVAQKAAVREVIMDLNGKEITDIANIDASMRTLAKCVISWEGITNKGEPLKLTEQHAHTLFKRHPWIFTQCDRKASDRANFTTA